MSYPNIDFLYLSEEDMIKAGVTDMANCVEAMEELLKTLNLGDYMMSGDNGNGHGAMVTFPDKPEFPNMPKNGVDRRFMAMPAYLGGKFDAAGCKWYGSNIENREKGLPRSILMFMLNDKETGAPLALMSANLLSAYRTGAVPGVGAKYFAPKHAKVAGIVGPGVMAKTTLQSFVCTCPELDTIKVKGRGKDSLNSFIEFVKEELPQIKNIELVDTLEDAVRDCDIVTVAVSTALTMADYPLIKTEWIKKGAYLAMPSTVMFEDDFLISGCKKFVDSMKMAEAWDAEVPYPVYEKIPVLSARFTDMVHEGKITKDDFIEIGDVLNGKAIGRDNDDQIIVFSVQGMPIEDIAWGKVVYDNAVDKGIGIKLNLWKEPKMH